MAFVSPNITEGNEEQKTPTNDKKEKIRLSKLDELGLCPHKAFPSTPVDRNKFNHNQYLEYLTQLRSYGKPWFIPPPTIAKRKKLKLKPMEITNIHPLKKKEKDDVAPLEDLSKYLVLQNTCENMKCRKKKKKKNILSKSGVGYSIKVTDDLAFLLRTMADAREHLVQKAIENKWREEEEERKAKEKGDIPALRNLIEGMMIKFIKIEEERQAQLEMKENQGSDEGKRPSKRKSSDEGSRKSDLVQEPKFNNQELTKDLVGFLKSLLEADNKRKEATYEEKDTSITDLEKFLQNDEEKLEEAAQEEGEEEEKEKEVEDEGKEKEDEEAKQDGEMGETVDIENGKVEEEKEKEGDDNFGNEGNIDFNEVNKRLEDLANNLEGTENEEKQGEEEVEEEEKISEWVKSLVSPRPSPKIKVEVSTQFDYALERKLALGIKHEPKDVTEDLTVFLKTMMMADPTIREVIKEKELKEYWKKIENFDSWAHGARNDSKQNTNKATYKCAKKTRKTKRKSKKPEKPSDSIELENGYLLQPNEFLMLLKGVYNTLTIAEELDEQRKLHEETESEVDDDDIEFKSSTMEPSLLVQLTDYINEARSVIEDEQKFDEAADI